MALHVRLPFVGFDGIPFRTVTDSMTQTPVWEVRPIWARRKVSGSSVVKRQLMGYDTDRLPLQVMVADGIDFALLEAAIGTESTLVLPPRTVMIAPASRQFHQLNRDYVEFPLTTLVEIQGARRLYDGRGLCTLMFEREHETGVI